MFPASASRQARLCGLANDAESVAVGIDEDDEVVLGTGLALVAGRAEREEPLDLCLPVVCVGT